MMNNKKNCSDYLEIVKKKEEIQDVMQLLKRNSLVSLCCLHWLGNISENDYKHFFYYDLVAGALGYELSVLWIGIEG